MKTMTRMIRTTLLVSLFMLTTTFLPAGSSSAQEVITPLVAVQNGLKVANDMIAQGKLDLGWAADLSSVTVTIRNIKGFSEYVVTLTRSSGTPAEASIYINMSGGYSGSSLSTESVPGEKESGY
ncbi:MAG: DUF6488 family protein [Desulfobacteraceae bacterium]|nr:DUF6488 family protein [Desulfobacteraceae bacterium]